MENMIISLAKKLAEHVVKITDETIFFDKIGAEIIKEMNQDEWNILRVPVAMFYQKNIIFATMMK